MERDQAMAQQNMQAQAQSQQMAAQETAKVEMEKDQAKAQTEENLEQVKNALKIKYLRQEAIVKKELMMLEFELNSKIKEKEREVSTNLESIREDRKDERVDRQAMLQKSMIEQRKTSDSLNKFESSGNDILTGRADLDRFTP